MDKQTWYDKTSVIVEILNVNPVEPEVKLTTKIWYTDIVPK